MQQEIQTVNGDRKITKCILNDSEWSNFVEFAYSSLISEKVAEKEAKQKRDELVEHQCAPMIPSDIMKSLKVSTPIVGIVNGEYGDLFYRAWWAENGGAAGTAKVATELGDVVALSNEFKTWFKKLPFGSTMVGVFAVNKQIDTFDISTVRAWIALKYGINLDNDKDLKIVRMKSWVWSAELTALWFHSSIIKSTDRGFTFLN